MNVFSDPEAQNAMQLLFSSLYGGGISRFETREASETFT